MFHRPLGHHGASLERGNAHHHRCGARSRAPERRRTHLPRASARGRDDPGRSRRPRTRLLRGSASAAAWIHSKGGAAFLAHPYCSGVEPQTFLDAHDVLWIEVFNAGYEIESGCGHAEWFRDAVLGAGRPCLTIATDDSHDGPDCLNAWTMIRAAERSREGVVEALRKGHFYSSAGPTIYDARERG